MESPGFAAAYGGSEPEMLAIKETYLKQKDYKEDSTELTPTPGTTLFPPSMLARAIAKCCEKE
jgi:hypothetical protein